MWWVKWFCLPLALERWHRDLPLDSPTHDQACARRARFLPPSRFVPVPSRLSAPRTQTLQPNVYFSAQWAGVGTDIPRFSLSSNLYVIM